MPLYLRKAWSNSGFDYVDIYDGYIRISDNQFDITGTTVILMDGTGEFKAYYICENGNEMAIEFSSDMSRCLLKTWRWMKLELIN